MCVWGFRYFSRQFTTLCLHFLFVQVLQVYQKWEITAEVFPQHAHIYAHCMIFLITRNMSEFFITPYQLHISLFFRFTFLVSHLFTPTEITPSGSCSVKQLPLIVYDKCSGIDLFAENELWFSSDKDNSWEWGFQGTSTHVK